MFRVLKLTWCSLALLGFCSVAEARTGNELILDLRVMLGQTSQTANTTNWTNAVLYQCLNIALDKVSARGRVVERDTIYGGVGTSGDGAIRLNRPARFITLRGSAYLMRNGKEIKPIPLANPDSLYRLQPRITRQSMGPDNHVLYEESDDIVLAPAVWSKDSIRVIFYESSAPIDSLSECAYPDEWETVLLYEAKLVACEKIRDADWYDRTAKERDELLLQMYQQTRLRPQMVKQP